MSIENLHLRKLAQLLFASEKQRHSLLRSEVRQDYAKLAGKKISGGDFYAPFWSDVKAHVSGEADIRELVKERISSNGGRARLYPVLAKGFLSWWDESRRWTNAPFSIDTAPSSSYKFDEILIIRLDSFLAVKDFDGVTRYIYPYFYESPVLRNEGARVCLWVIREAFRALPFENFRVLDVPRGRVYSPDRCYLEGDEASVLRTKYREIWKLYSEIEENWL